MRIGLDFDNTIVSYDVLFHKVAAEQGVIPAGTPVNKLAVRDYLRSAGKEPVWTEMQGTVYGARMDEAAAFPGVIEFMRGAIRAGHELAIVSHKTKKPFLGPQYDLHAAARAWVEHHLLEGGEPLIPPGQVFFELTKEAKLARIDSFGCNVFIDDLPEILAAAAFPATVQRILFDPEGHYAAMTLEGVTTCHSWEEITQCLIP